MEGPPPDQQQREQGATRAWNCDRGVCAVCGLHRDHWHWPKTPTPAPLSWGCNYVDNQGQQDEGSSRTGGSRTKGSRTGLQLGGQAPGRDDVDDAAGSTNQT